MLFTGFDVVIFIRMYGEAFHKIPNFHGFMTVNILFQSSLVEGCRLPVRMQGGDDWRKCVIGTLK
jgi:hypothetical protein